MKVWTALALLALAGCGGEGGGNDGAAGGAGGAGGSVAPAPDAAGGGGGGGDAPDAALEAAVTGLRLGPAELTLKRGAEARLVVTALRDDGSEVDVTDQAAFETSNADVATVAAGGAVTVLRGGAVTLTARVGEHTATLETRAACDYPRFASAIRYGSVMPPLFWQGAFHRDGAPFDFRLEDVHCDVAWKDTKVVFFIVSAGWCAPCTVYAQRLRPDAAAIEAAGGLIVFLEAETEDFGPADNAYAQRHIDHIIGDAYGIRLGDDEAQPRRNWLHAQPIVTGFPTVIAVRTRDMQVITDSNHSQYYLPLEQIAADPEADWSNPGPPPFSNHCAPGDEEASEPNDAVAQAAPLTPGEIGAGICNESPDFYRIDVAGEWRVTVDFDHDVGDIDVFAWNEAINQPLQVGQNLVGSNGTGDRETFAWRGPTTIAVIGYQGASAPYRLTLEAQ